MIKNRLFLLVAAIASIALMSSCAKISPEQISINSVQSFTMRSMSRADVVINVENLSGKTIKLEHAKLTLKSGDQPIADILLRDPIIVPKRSTNNIEFSLQVKLTNPLAAFGLAKEMLSNSKKLNVDCTAEVKAGMFRKKLILTSVPFSDIISNFGITAEEIFKNI